mmetsp:Transcript_96001/g.266656  ORF Transcript_96001/g.266656 Transcript_96001/m.266656 type:complete len:303 (-) Transcript_96001:136-1044(-)
MPSSSASPPPGFGYITSTVPASSSTKEMMARLARSALATRTTLPQESNLSCAFSAPRLPLLMSTKGTARAPRGGRSSADVSSPALKRWMRPCVFSAASSRRMSSGSEPSRAATSRRKSAKGRSSGSSSGRFPSSFTMLCLKLSSRVGGGPTPPSTNLAQESASKPLLKVTAATFGPNAAWMRFRTGASSALRSSSVLWSSNRAASMLMQLNNSLPWYSFRNCTAYSSTGSTMYKISYPSLFRPSMYGDREASLRFLPVMKRMWRWPGFILPMYSSKETSPSPDFDEWYRRSGMMFCRFALSS